jgi:hypothetical protein
MLGGWKDTMVYIICDNNLIIFNTYKALIYHGRCLEKKL